MGARLALIIATPSRTSFIFMKNGKCIRVSDKHGAVLTRLVCVGDR